MSELTKAPPAKRRWSADDLERARALTLEHLSATPAAPAAEPIALSAVEAAPAAPPRYGPLFRTAAVCSQFRIETLAEPGADPAEIARLETASIELRDAAAPGWRTLDPDVRNDVLRQMTREEIEHHLPGRIDASDAFHRALRIALDGVRGDELLQFDSRVLLTLLQLYDGLSKQLPLPPRTEIERELELGRLLEPLRHLTRTFNGRAAELQRLRDYVGVLPPPTFLGKIAFAITASFKPVRKPPYLIYGPGGVGKTTLVARFILDHALVASKLQFPFVYLDFDRPTVSDSQTSTLLIEAVRQIGLQYESAYAASAAFRKRWERSLRNVSSSTDYLDADLFENFVIFLDTLEVSEGPVLFVLDTFEEVQLRSQTYERGVIEVMNRLSEHVPRLRVVIAGRSPIEGIDPANTEKLLQFDRDAAIAYLVAHDVAPDAAAEIYRAVGGSPLALTLALDIHRRDPKELRGQRGFRIDTAQLQGEVVQLQLFDRILLHIKDPDVRKLAHPGLVMRRITPEIILEVLAGPCEIAVRDLDHAKELFDALAQDATLVVRPDPHKRVLLQRTDVRHLMLGPLRRDARAKVNEIHRLAVVFYGKELGLEARTEEVYHRLALGQSRDEIAPLVTSEMKTSLLEVFEELDPPEQALLAELLNVELTPEARRAADQLSWERTTSRRVKEAIRVNSDLHSVLGILLERRERSGATDLALSEVMLYDALDDDLRAKNLADAAILIYRNEGHVEFLLLATLLAVKLEQALGNDQAALARLLDAEEIARRNGEPIALVRVLRHRYAYLGIAEEEPPATLRTELIDNVARVSDTAWAADLPLLRGVAEVIGRDEPAIVERALRLGALELSRSSLALVHDMFGKPLSELPIDARIADAVLTLLRKEEEQRQRRKTTRGKREHAPSIHLTVAKRKALRDLLAKYYGPRLGELAFSRLGVGLEAASFESRDTSTTAADLIRVAERTDGMLPELIIGVWRAQFDNPEVLAFIDDIGLGPVIRGTDALPESEIRPIVSEYRGSIGALDARTCSVWRRKQPAGCGFLTGPNVVTTLSRVSGTDPDDVQMWFSRVNFKGAFLNEGQSARPHRRANLSKPPVGVQHAMEIDRPLGQAPIEESLAGHGATPRGWVTTVTRVPISGEALLWLWRDNGVTFISGTKLKSMEHMDSGRIPCAAAPLAAGAPCFDLNLRVIGIHDGSAILLF